MKALLLHFEDETLEAGRLARAAGLRIAAVIERHRFPDDELRAASARAPARPCRRHRSLHRPNEKLLELLLVAARRGGWVRNT